MILFRFLKRFIWFQFLQNVLKWPRNRNHDSLGIGIISALLKTIALILCTVLRKKIPAKFLTLKMFRCSPPKRTPKTGRNVFTPLCMFPQRINLDRAQPHRGERKSAMKNVPYLNARWCNLMAQRSWASERSRNWSGIAELMNSRASKRDRDSLRAETTKSIRHSLSIELGKWSDSLVKLVGSLTLGCSVHKRPLIFP